MSYRDLTVLLLVPLALACGFRDRVRVAGFAFGAAVGANLRDIHASGGR